MKKIQASQQGMCTRIPLCTTHFVVLRKATHGLSHARKHCVTISFCSFCDVLLHLAQVNLPVPWLVLLCLQVSEPSCKSDFRYTRQWTVVFTRSFLEIRKCLSVINLLDVKHDIKSVDCQISVQGSILVIGQRTVFYLPGDVMNLLP